MYISVIKLLSNVSVLIVNKYILRRKLAGFLNNIHIPEVDRILFSLFLDFNYIFGVTHVGGDHTTILSTLN